VLLFPERDEPRHRWLLPLAIAVSLLIHVLVGGAWLLLGHRVAVAVAKLLPRPTPTPEIVALSDAITIEKRTVPREAHRSRALRPQHRAQPHPPTLAQVPRLRELPVPTLPPLPTTAPTVPPTSVPTIVPTSRPIRPAHHRLFVEPAQRVPRAEPTPPPQRIVRIPASRPAQPNAFSPQQIAALDQQFKRTIASADRSLTDVPRQRRPPAIAPNERRYQAVMAGTPEQFLSAQGDCTSVQSNAHAAFVDRYLRCLIRYSDGYYEEVSFPWVFRFARRTDPFAYLDDLPHPFPMQQPPPGFVLPQPFALSRAICSFYRAECESLIDRERANGNQPAPP
jgi:hypothetical protein